MHHAKSWLRSFGSAQRKRVSRHREPRILSSRVCRIELLEDRLALATSETLVSNGASGRRIDMVFVGDGFTSADMYLYESHVDQIAEDFFEASPFDSYASYFNIHRVNEESVDSGIDRNNVSPSISKNTSFNGQVNSNGRLQWDVELAKDAAEVAPDWDMIEGIFNNTDNGIAFYGRANAGFGGGISSQQLMYDTYTFESVDVFLHEAGHSLGNLGDEYVEGAGIPYSGGDPPFRNLTTSSTGAKWANWLDVPGIGAWPGGNVDYSSGIYRPAFNSRMRNHHQEFSVVDKESIIIEMYALDEISTIDDATPSGSYAWNHDFFVTPMTPTHGLDVQWYVDDVAVSGANGDTFSAADFGFARGEYSLRVEVTDNTTMVRDEAAREDYMVGSRQWTINSAIEVQTGIDEDGTNPAAMSLREALDLAANATTHPGPDSIVFLPTVTAVLLDSELVLDSDVEISGPGSNLLTIDAQENGRVFYVNSDVTATVEGLRITGGFTTGNDRGGGVYSAGNLTLVSVELSGNFTESFGGGVYNANGLLKVDRSTISSNYGDYGGGIASKSDSSNSVVIENSAIINNEAVEGGGVHVDDASNVTGPSAYFVNSTFSENFAESYGGAIRKSNLLTLTVVNCTITDNVATDGGGIRNGSGTTIFHNTILAENSATTASTDDLSGTSLDSGSSYNLIGADVAVAGGGPGTGTRRLLTSESAGLRSLGEYGGKTKSHELLPNSLARDKGSDALADGPTSIALLLDQRGHQRIYDDPSLGTSGTRVDIGAAEFSLPHVTNVVISNNQGYSLNEPFTFGPSNVGSGVQIKTVPVSNANQISIQFNKEVDVQDDDLSLIPLRTVVLVAEPISFTPPTMENGYTATWRYTPFENSQYLLRVSQAITDLAGVQLDGEWVNPSSVNSTGSSEFPSGDFVEGGNFEFVFTILQGDANRDLMVDVVDLGRLATYLNEPILNAFDRRWEHGDFNGYANVDVGDLGTYATAMGTDWRNLLILGDYNNDFDVDGGATGSDEDLFESYHYAENELADLKNDNVWDELDEDIFAAILARQIHLDVV
jgi:hypothetical protein